MKQLNIYFEDVEYNKMLKIKQIHGGNWHDFLKDLIFIYGEKNEKK